MVIFIIFTHESYITNILHTALQNGGRQSLQNNSIQDNKVGPLAALTAADSQQVFIDSKSFFWESVSVRE